jgi:hypothetical protein
MAMDITPFMIVPFQCTCFEGFPLLCWIAGGFQYWFCAHSSKRLGKLGAIRLQPSIPNSSRGKQPLATGPRNARDKVQDNTVLIIK